MSDAADTIGNLGGLSKVQALRLEVQRLTARVNFMGEQVAKAWAETRQLTRELDARAGRECTLAYTHPAGPSCGRCGTRPDGTVG